MTAINIKPRRERKERKALNDLREMIRGWPYRELTDQEIAWLFARDDKNHKGNDDRLHK